MFYIFLALSVFMLSAAGTGLVLFLLRKYNVLDMPNARSNHSRPTPRGGGIAVVIAVLLGMTGASIFSEHTQFLFPLSGCITLLALVSFYDDLKGASIRWRLAAQIIAIIAGLYFAPMPSLLFQGTIPAIVETVFLGLVWLWFINLYNFMDGIDGITGSETACIGVGVALIASLTPATAAFVPYGIIIAASAIAFLLWNWHPAKIFLGDVGSVSLGYLLGWLLLQLATQGAWAAALIIPAYYVADSSVTLLKRIMRGEKFWESHSQHFYQQAVRSGYSHAQVVRTIFFVNSLLIGLAFLSTLGPFYLAASLLVAYSMVGGLLLCWHPAKLSKK